MESLDCILQRRSVRKYKDEQLPREMIEKIIDYTKYAPSWANTKVVRYMCVVDKELKSKLANCSDPANAHYIEQAPALFVLTAVKGRCGTDRRGGIYYHTPKEWLMFDAGIAAQTLCLVAYDLGVSTLIMGVFDGDRYVDLLDIPEDQELVAIISAGYADEKPVAPKRKETSEILQIL
ncbi:MAG: nitroreductase family protein [Eubacteriales bacterium]